MVKQQNKFKRALLCVKIAIFKSFMNKKSYFYEYKVERGGFRNPPFNPITPPSNSVTPVATANAHS